MTTTWGPVMWKFLHTIVESINENHYEKVYKELFGHLKSICNLLPCPKCSYHAKEYLRRINTVHISTKNGFRNMLFNFHNEVNKRKNKPLFNIDDIGIYKEYSLVECYNDFVKIFAKKGNLQQINESFQRKLILQKFINWLKVNRIYFVSV